MSSLDDKKQSPPEKPQEEPLDGTYANVFQVVFSPADFVLDFGRAVPGRQDVKLMSRVIMAPLHVKQLALKLAESVRKFEEQFGPIAAPPAPAPDGEPKFKQ